MKVVKRNIIEDKCLKKGNNKPTNKYKILSDFDDNIPNIVRVESIIDEELNDAGSIFRRNDKNTKLPNEIEVPAVLMHDLLNNSQCESIR